MSAEKKKKPTKTKKKPKNKKKLVSVNTILLTIIITAITIFILINLGQIFSSLSAPSKDENSSDEGLIIQNYTDAEAEESGDAIENVTISSEDAPTSTYDAREEPQEKNTQSEQSSTDETVSAQTDETDAMPVSAQDEATPSDNVVTLTVYFVQISDNEKVSIVARPRVVQKTPAILTQTIKKLLEGPTAEERASGLQDFIPKGTRLNRISVTNSVAFLDFNEEFQFNEFGTAGILAQLYQIVYTCTEIPLINAVQITIENKQVKYLGGEGIIEVSAPITRAYLDTF